MRLTLLFIVVAVIALATFMIVASINAGRVDMLALRGVEPTATFSAIEYTSDFAVVRHIEFGTPLDYSLGLPEVYRLTMPRDKALIDAICRALRNCRESESRPELANFAAVCIHLTDGRSVSMGVAPSGNEGLVYLEHCRYESKDLYLVLNQIVAARRGLARREWCD
jgi:hypothetical protein